MAEEAPSAQPRQRIALDSQIAGAAPPRRRQAASTARRQGACEERRGRVRAVYPPAPSFFYAVYRVTRYSAPFPRERGLYACRSPRFAPPAEGKGPRLSPSPARFLLLKEVFPQFCARGAYTRPFHGNGAYTGKVPALWKNRLYGLCARPRPGKSKPRLTSGRAKGNPAGARKKHN